MLKKISVYVILGFMMLALLFGAYAFFKEKNYLSEYSELSKERVRANVDLQPKVQKTATFTGSQKCQECHKEEHDMNRESMHSKMIQDVRKDPSVIVADFSTLPEDASFTREQVVYTIGSKFKQRFMLRKDVNGKEDYVLGNYQWNAENKKWQKYKVFGDWYGKAFHKDNEKVPTSLTCDGCHFVGFMGEDKKRIEPAIGCESCHGPGSEHVDDPESPIYKASASDPQRSTEVCLQCHMRNRDKRLEKAEMQELFGDVKDYPDGFEPGNPLADYKTPAPRTPGVESREFWGNGAAKKNRTQGNEYVRSVMYKHGVTCINCHNPHSTDNTAKNSRGDESCMTCHKFGTLIGPHQKDLEAHTRHKADSEGSSCIECHMPKVAKHTKKSPMTVRTHLFGFIYPDETRKFGVPNGCNSCHKDESLEWSEKYLKEWGMISWEKENIVPPKVEKKKKDKKKDAAKADKKDGSGDQSKDKAAGADAAKGKDAGTDATQGKDAGADPAKGKDPAPATDQAKPAEAEAPAAEPAKDAAGTVDSSMDKGAAVEAPQDKPSTADAPASKY